MNPSHLGLKVSRNEHKVKRVNTAMPIVAATLVNVVPKYDESMDVLAKMAAQLIVGCQGSEEEFVAALHVWCEAWREERAKIEGQNGNGAAGPDDEEDEDEDETAGAA